ncbi:MAG: hypothetical protein LBL41_01425 [Bifidobacteriaceae bacterium]|nr:hypothetical protein [Bifidobacteriaceae bacterium]
MYERKGDGASRKETTSESASTSPCNEKLEKVLSYYRSRETKKQIILSFASRNKVPNFPPIVLPCNACVEHVYLTLGRLAQW